MLATANSITAKTLRTVPRYRVYESIMLVVVAIGPFSSKNIENTIWNFTNKTSMADTTTETYSR